MIKENTIMNKKILFLDESGDHNLTIIDPMHPIFVLGGIIACEDYALGEMTDKLNDFKQELFGTTNITLHTADFTRHRNGFEKLKDKSFFHEFYSKLNLLISSLDITILACAIKKELHIDKYGVDAIDPYHLSMNVLIELFCFDIGQDGIEGQIIAEAREVKLDRKLDLAWQNVQVSGTKFMKAIEINRRVNNLSLKTKKDNLAGIEIADIIVTPIARHVLNKVSKIDINVIKDKIRRNKTGEI
jgi:hypothetical protein